MKFSINNITIWLVIFLMFNLSCKKFIEVSAPTTSVNGENVYQNDNTAISVLTAIYAQMSGNLDGQRSITSISLFPELSGDNLALFTVSNTAFAPYYQNNLKASSNNNYGTPPYWNQLYTYIYQTNAAIEGLSSSHSLTASVRNQLLGEAQFMRAFFYFYLVNMYGDVPLVLTTNYKLNSTMPRTSKGTIYQQIVVDLKNAQPLLNEDYMDVSLMKNTSERIRPNKGAAIALLARAYLYSGDYVNAEIESSKLLENNSNYNLVALNGVFTKNSKETIWSLQPVAINFNTWESREFILPATGPNIEFPLTLSDQLITAFGSTDQRLAKWIGTVETGSKKYFYSAKYKAGSTTTAVSEYEMVFRLAEQFLIRAESRAQLGKLTGQNSAVSDLNAIRERAGLLPSSAVTKTDILDAILEERQKEFFTEWGHRWFDLKRTGKIDAVMSTVAPLKGGTWEPYKALYPIPQAQININPGMKGQQNPGYSN